MPRTFEPTIVTRLLAKVETHGVAASELCVMLYAIRGAARAIAALAGMTRRGAARFSPSL